MGSSREELLNNLMDRLRQKNMDLKREVERLTLIVMSTPTV